MCCVTILCHTKPAWDADQRGIRGKILKKSMTTLPNSCIRGSHSWTVVTNRNFPSAKPLKSLNTKGTKYTKGKGKNDRGIPSTNDGPRIHESQPASLMIHDPFVDGFHEPEFSQHQAASPLKASNTKGTKQNIFPSLRACGVALSPGWISQAGNCARLRPPDLAEITGKPGKVICRFGQKDIKIGG